MQTLEAYPMNNERRKSINNLINLIDDARAQLETVKDEEQEAYDNLPEGLQQADRGQASEQAISALEDAISSLEDAVGSLEEAAQ